MNTLRFTKMHGVGNDFIVFEAASDSAIPSGEAMRALADRHTGIGFDQALVLTAPRRSGTVTYYRIFNADGTEVEQCGNGARCVAEWLRLHGRASNDELLMDSPSGPVRARLRERGQVSVDMGVPNFDPASLPFLVDRPAERYTLDVAGERVEFAVVSMGNPHAVILVADAESARVDTFGPALQRHPAFPRSVNVGFMQVVARDAIVLRVYERGVGETLACGTGACAAVAAGRRAGRLDTRVEVRTPGGRLTVEWQGPGEVCWLTGPAEVAFRGEIDI